MWGVYKDLQRGVSTETNEFLIDEVITMMGRIDTESFISSLRRMYGQNIKVTVNPVEAALLFSRGLKQNQFFLFCDFLEKLRGSSKH